MTRAAIPWLDPDLEPARLSDPQYREQKLQQYEADPAKWKWYLLPHSHLCRRCDRTITHTGLQAAANPDSHQCCGRDVRLTIPS